MLGSGCSKHIFHPIGAPNMKKFHIVRTSEALVGHAGLAAVGQLLRLGRIDDSCLHRESPNTTIKDCDILRSICGLLAQGKTDFDNIKQFSDDAFFPQALGLKKVPSSETLRQRLEKMAQDQKVMDGLKACSRLLWKKTNMKPEVTSVGARRWVRLDSDVSIHDNGNTKKEGVERAYDGTFGFAPFYSYLGGGYLINAVLRPGSAHSLCEGTLPVIRQAVEDAYDLTEERILSVFDCGFDSVETIQLFHELQKSSDFILKHNLRRESKSRWLETAKSLGTPMSPRRGKTVWRGSTTRTVKGVGPVRMVFEVTERMDKKGQMLLNPDVTVFVVWTSLDLPEDDVLRLYRERGTSEQYHAEFKSEMDMERFPSGKFQVNELFLQLGALVYNMLRVMGGDLVVADTLGLKPATRRRLRTVIQGLVLMSGKLVEHARRTWLKVSCPVGWCEAFAGLYARLQQT